MIAKKSQRTADESKSVAVETRRDGTSMKTIAGLTMIYLPSTFVATIFSTGFFNVAASGSGNLTISREIWKFIIVAAVLIVLTITVWIFLNKHGVPSVLKWAIRDSPGMKEDAKQTQHLARILLDLPQQPGNKANDTNIAASPELASNSQKSVIGRSVRQRGPSSQPKVSKEGDDAQIMV